MVAALDRDVDRAAEQVQLPHGVPGGVRPRAQRLVVLEVAGAETVRTQPAVPAPVHLGRGQVEVGTLSGEPVELDQRGLDLGMAVYVWRIRRAELAHEQVGEPRRDR